MAANAGIGGVLTVHRFAHQSGRGEGSGGLKSSIYHVFSARVFLDMSQEKKIDNIIEFLGQTGAGVGRGGDEAGMGMGSSLPRQWPLALPLLWERVGWHLPLVGCLSGRS